MVELDNLDEYSDEELMIEIKDKGDYLIDMYTRTQGSPLLRHVYEMRESMDECLEILQELERRKRDEIEDS